MDILGQVLTFLQSVTGKSLLLYGFGWLLKINPKFADEAIPAATLCLNILVALVGAAVEAHGIKPAFMFAAVASGPQFNPILDVLLPQVIADGAYNWPRKIWAFLQGVLAKKKK